MATSRTHAHLPPGAKPPLLFRLLTRRLSHTSRRHMILPVATADETYYGLRFRLPPAFLAALVRTLHPSLPFSHRPQLSRPVIAMPKQTPLLAAFP